MSHEGPDYSLLGGAHISESDYVSGTSCFENLRNHDIGWNDGKGLWVIWTDGYNQKHKVTLKSKTDELSVFFPVSGTEVHWYAGPKKAYDCTVFPLTCAWAQVKFFYVGSNWMGNHGVRINARGYSLIRGDAEVDWERVRGELQAGKSMAEIAKVAVSKSDE